MLKRYLLILLILSLFACEEQEQKLSEKWIGHYEAPGLNVEFPIFMEITITGNSVSGRSVDSSDIATINGTVNKNIYEILLHPLDEGESTDQDVYFRGTRTGDTITGKWEHVTGASGPWTAKSTELDEKAALQLYIPPCEDTVIAESKLEQSCAGALNQSLHTDGTKRRP